MAQLILRARLSSFSVGFMMSWLLRGVLAFLLCASLNGCQPSSQSQMEEEKEAHFLAGKNCINSMDYPGAIEEFEKALEVNPRSASAHFQLGWLYEEKEPDAAAAIYHYQRSLMLRPDAENAEWIKQRINNCKQDLAKTVLPLPITPGMQHQFEQLAEENKRLRDENDRWKAYFSSRSPSPTNPPIQNSSVDQTASVPLRLASMSNSVTTNRVAIPSARTHSVQPGESPYSIAKKYGIKLDSLMAANPGLDPRRMRVGQVLNIPTP
jgi:LysM repeat protein